MGVDLSIDNIDRCLNYDPVGSHPALALNLTRAVRVSDRDCPTEASAALTAASLATTSLLATWRAALVTSKAAGEMLLAGYAASYGIAGAALRFSSVYGPGSQAKDDLVARLMRAARDGKGVQIHGDGTQLRDLVHVDDVVAGIFAAWRSGHTGPLALGSGESVTVNDIVSAARSVTGAEIPAEHVPPKPGEMPAVIIDISAARSLGYAPGYDLKAGIATVWPEFSETAK